MFGNFALMASTFTRSALGFYLETKSWVSINPENVFYLIMDKLLMVYELMDLPVPQFIDSSIAIAPLPRPAWYSVRYGTPWSTPKDQNPCGLKDTYI